MAGPILPIDGSSRPAHPTAVVAKEAAKEVLMYVVAGVSGRTGSVVANTLLQAGKRVRVIVRDALKGAPWRARGADVAVASLHDQEGLARALAGAAGAYLISPQDMKSSDPISDGWRIADAIARAVDTTALGHVVLLSSMAAPHAEGTGLFQTLHAAEERLAGVSPRITFLRAGYFLENWAPVLGAAADGKLPTFIRPDQVLPMVSIRDIGGAAARALLEGPPAKRRDLVELSGPRDYSPRDLAGALAKLLDHPVEPEHVPLDAVVPLFTGFGASMAFAEQLRLLYEGIDGSKLARQRDGVRSHRGSVSAESFLREALAAPRRS
jgi:uncharacterized protein YbjT (DUF2867 family)